MPVDIAIGSDSHALMGIANGVCRIDGGLPSGFQDTFTNSLFLTHYGPAGAQLSYTTFGYPGAAGFGGARALFAVDGSLWLAVGLNNSSFTWVPGSTCTASGGFDTHAVCLAHINADGSFDFEAKYRTSVAGSAEATLRGAALAGQGAVVIGRGYGNGSHSSNLGYPVARWGPFLMHAQLGGVGWIAWLSGDNGDPHDVTVDRGSGAVYVTGTTGTNGQPSHFGSATANDVVIAANVDAGGDNRFVARYETDGGIRWAFGLASWSTAGIASVAAEDNYVWIAAPFTGAITPLTAGAASGLTSIGNVGTTDIALVRVNAGNGIPQEGYRLGGKGDEQVIDLAFDGDGGLTLWGSTTVGSWDAGWPNTNNGGGVFALTFAGRTSGLQLRATHFFADAGAVGLRGGYDRFGLPVLGGALPSGASIDFGSGPLTDPGLFLGRER